MAKVNPWGAPCRESTGNVSRSGEHAAVDFDPDELYHSTLSQFSPPTHDDNLYVCKVRA